MLASFLKKVADAVRDITKRNFSPRISGPPAPAGELPAVPAEPARPRRKNIAGAFAKHHRRKGLRAWSPPGRQLRLLVAIPTRQGLKVTSRDRMRKMLAALNARNPSVPSVP